MDRRIGTSYLHEQTVASNSWVVVHNLGDYPIVDAYVMFEGDLTKVIPKGVTYQDKNTCLVTFTDPVTGVATVV